MTVMDPKRLQSYNPETETGMFLCCNSVVNVKLTEATPCPECGKSYQINKRKIEVTL
jgi:hypothetical protein